MNGLYDGAMAALPWIAVGLVLAIFFARSASHKKKTEKIEDYGTEGMSLGMCIGVAMATAMHMNVWLGLSIGMVIGLAVGSSMKKEE